MGQPIRRVVVSPEKAFTPLAVKLGFEATNNIAEYEACILALEAALELGIKELEVFGDSALIICQIKGEWKLEMRSCCHTRPFWKL